MSSITHTSIMFHAHKSVSLPTLTKFLHDERNWLCVISSDTENNDVDIHSECGTMMDGGGSRFFVFDVSGGRSYAWMAVAGALEEGNKVVVLHLGIGDPSFPDSASFTCVHPVTQGVSYKDHIHKTFDDMKTMFVNG